MIHWERLHKMLSPKRELDIEKVWIFFFVNSKKTELQWVCFLHSNVVSFPQNLVLGCRKKILCSCFKTKQNWNKKNQYFSFLWLKNSGKNQYFSVKHFISKIMPIFWLLNLERILIYQNFFLMKKCYLPLNLMWKLQKKS